MHKNRALILRSNRFLVSSLQDKGLITSAQMEAANEKFIEAAQNANTYKNNSILKILVHDLKALDEDKVLRFIAEEHKIGLVDLKQTQLYKPSSIELDLSLCWATLTVPFDQVDQTFMLATCYYMSSPALKYWKELLGGNVIWYATSIVSINYYIEAFEKQLTEDDSAEDENV